MRNLFQVRSHNRAMRSPDTFLAAEKATNHTAAHANASPTPEPAIFVIFGITGNLARAKLLPALYHLLKDNLLHEHTVIIGVSRHKLKPEDILKDVELCVLEEDKMCDQQVIAAFKRRLKLTQLDATNADDYDTLLETLNTVEQDHGMCMNRLYYLAIPPQVYGPVIESLGRHNLNKGCPHGVGKARLLVEKPFGYDLTSARELVKHTAAHFSEEQIFRIDHYLAKETAQNILVFREQNPIFSRDWDRKHISAIDLVFSEKISVAGRKEFYDNVGALRDVVQNHLLQLLALTTTELPRASSSAALHHAKQALLASIRTVNMQTDHVIRGQYRGYQEEVENPGSTTETYVRLPLHIDNRRWRGVRITMTAGKALAAKETSITITFGRGDLRHTNRLQFRIQPNEGISVELTAKRPGFANQTQEVLMNFSYHGTYGDPEHPDAYERVLIDAVKGDHSLFATSAEVLESWRILQPILTHWEQSSDSLKLYKPGSSGPSIDSMYSN